MSRTSTRSLTQGDPLRLILTFASPLLFGFLFQQFYSFVDTAIVGKVLGAAKLAAVGDTGSINFLVLGFCQGACAGFSCKKGPAIPAGPSESGITPVRNHCLRDPCFPPEKHIRCYPRCFLPRSPA